MPMKKKILCAVLCAAGLCFAAEAFCRHCPWALPDFINILRIKYSLMHRYTLRDDDVGCVVAADFHQVFKWRGRKVEIRNAPFPGQSRAGYRVDSRSLGLAHADIIALGDSFTSAVEVDQDSTWASRLGAISGLQVANLGVPGYGAAQEAEFFRRYGSKLRPRLVVVLLGSSEPSKNMAYRSWRLLNDRNDPSHPELRYDRYMFCGSVGVSGGMCKGLEFAARSGILPRLTLDWLLFRWKGMRMMNPESAYADAGRQITYQALDDLRNQAASQGAKFCVVTSTFWEPLFPKSFHELTGFLRREGIPHLNLRLYKEYPGAKLRIPFDGHWNELGHALAAAEIHRFLLRNKLIPARLARRHG